MHPWTLTKAGVGLVIVLAGVLSVPGGSGRALFAQDRGSPPPVPATETPVDKYDRNLTLWVHQRSGYEKGWQRGREIYFMNCWMCHSEYVIAGDFLPVPSLRDVTKRLTDAQKDALLQVYRGFLQGA